MTQNTVVGTIPNILDPSQGPADVTFKNITGTYDLIATIESFQSVSNLTLLENALSGGTTSDPSYLASETQSFLYNYYSINQTMFPELGHGTPFDSVLSSLFSTPAYTVGTLAPDSSLSLHAAAAYNVIVGGPGNDLITGTSTGADLLDGGGGDNTINVGPGLSFVYGGSYGNNTIVGSSKQQSGTLDVLVGGPGGTNLGTALGDTVPGSAADPSASNANDTITAGSGDNILIGSPGTNTFYVDGSQDGSVTDVAWGNGGKTNYNLTGGVRVIPVNLPGVTLDQVAKLDPQTLYGITNVAKEVGPTTLFVINPGSQDTLSLDGTPLTGFSEGVGSPQEDLYQVVLQDELGDNLWTVSQMFTSPEQDLHVGDTTYSYEFGTNVPMKVMAVLNYVQEDAPQAIFNSAFAYESLDYEAGSSGSPYFPASYFTAWTSVSDPNNPSLSINYLDFWDFTQGDLGITVAQNQDQAHFTETFLSYTQELQAAYQFGASASSVIRLIGSERDMGATIIVPLGPLFDPTFLSYNGRVTGSVGTGSADNFVGGTGPTSFDGDGASVGQTDIEQGNSGDDRFVFASGYGHLEVQERGSNQGDANSTLAFGAGVDSNNVTTSENASGDLSILDGVVGDLITLDAANTLGSDAESIYGIRQVSFSDGTTYTLDQLVALKTVRTTGTPGADTLYGSSGADTFDGQGAPAGGQDYEQGNGGSDTFIYNLGYGQLEISETDSSDTPNNVLQIGSSVTAAQVEVTGDSLGNLYLADGRAGDQVKIDYGMDSTPYGVQSVRFADGSSLSKAQLIRFATTGTTGADTITGSSAPDTLDGKGAPAGAQDYEQGGGGGDTFIYNPGYGQLEISETDYSGSPDNVLQIGSGITAAQVTLSSDSNGNIYLADGIPGDLIELDHELSGSYYGVQTIQFSDGSYLSKDHPLTSDSSMIDVAAGASLTVFGDLATLGKSNGNNISLGLGAFLVAIGDANQVTTSGNDSIVLRGSRNEITGAGYGNHVTLGDGANVVALDGYGNAVTVGNGDNIITPGSGGDQVTAGGGDNTIALQGFSNTVALGAGTDVINGSAYNAITLNGTNLTLAEQGGTVVSVTSGDVVIAFEGYSGISSNNDIVYVANNNAMITLDGYNNTVAGFNLANAKSATGANGAVTVSGGLGNSTILLGDGQDSITLGGYVNTVDLGNGDDIVNAGLGNATVALGNGSDKVTVSGFGSSIVAGNGDDTVTGAGYGNHVNLGDGANVVALDGYGNAVTVGNGGNIIASGSGGDQVTAGGGNNTIALQGFNNTVTLGAGTDVINAGSDDTVTLTSTNLTLAGGTGAMVFIGAGHSVVADSSSGARVVVNSNSGSSSFIGFATDAKSVLDLQGGVGGYTTAASVVDALRSDGNGGTQLMLGSSSTSPSIDFLKTSILELTVDHFKVD